MNSQLETAISQVKSTSDVASHGGLFIVFTPMLKLVNLCLVYVRIPQQLTNQHLAFRYIPLRSKRGWV